MERCFRSCIHGNLDLSEGTRFTAHAQQKQQVINQNSRLLLSAAVFFSIQSKSKTDRLPTVCFAIVCFMKMNVQCEHFIFIYYTIFATLFQVEIG